MKRLYLYLTYAGAIPFIFCAVCLSFGIKTVPLLGAVSEILNLYALVITTFLAGSYWGQHLYLKGSWQYYLPILSNVVVIVLWLAFLVLSLEVQIILYIIAFILLLSVDHRLFRANLNTSSYFKLRCAVTTIVVVSLMVSLIMIS